MNRGGLLNLIKNNKKKLQLTSYFNSEETEVFPQKTRHKARMFLVIIFPRFVLEVSATAIRPKKKKKKKPGKKRYTD